MQGHPEYLYGLVEAAGLVIERDVATWIANQGGWVSSYLYLNLYLDLCLYLSNYSGWISFSMFDLVEERKYCFQPWKQSCEIIKEETKFNLDKFNQRAV